jgi:N-acetylglutamate synthase-like GNAT family acetyltransferase
MTLEQQPTIPGHELQLAREAFVEMTTYSGFSFHVRRADASDEPLLAEFFTHVTQDDLRFRFLSAIGKVGHAQLTLLTHGDGRRVQNVLAFDKVTGCIIASAMLAGDDALDQAEVAIVIRSDYKNRGVGWSLLHHVASRAAAMGVRTLQAIESHENRAAIQVERDMGFTSRPYPGDAALTLLERTFPQGGAELGGMEAP